MGSFTTLGSDRRVSFFNRGPLLAGDGLKKHIDTVRVLVQGRYGWKRKSVSVWWPFLTVASHDRNVALNGGLVQQLLQLGLVKSH